MLLNKQFAHSATCLGLSVYNWFLPGRYGPLYCTTCLLFPTNTSYQSVFTENSFSFPYLDKTSHSNNALLRLSKVKWNGMLWQYVSNIMRGRDDKCAVKMFRRSVWIQIIPRKWSLKLSYYVKRFLSCEMKRLLPRQRRLREKGRKLQAQVENVALTW